GRVLERPDRIASVQSAEITSEKRGQGIGLHSCPTSLFSTLRDHPYLHRWLRYGSAPHTCASPVLGDPGELEWHRCAVRHVRRSNLVNSRSLEVLRARPLSPRTQSLYSTRLCHGTQNKGPGTVERRSGSIRWHCSQQ